jgi:hypothetical protein
MEEHETNENPERIEQILTCGASSEWTRDPIGRRVFIIFYSLITLCFVSSFVLVLSSFPEAGVALFVCTILVVLIVFAALFFRRHDSVEKLPSCSPCWSEENIENGEQIQYAQVEEDLNINY